MKGEAAKIDLAKVVSLTAWRRIRARFSREQRPLWKGRVSALELLTLLVMSWNLLFIGGSIVCAGCALLGGDKYVMVGLYIVCVLLMPPVLLISVAAVVARLHDTGRSGRCLLIVLGACGLTGIVLASSSHYLVQVVVGYSIILVTLCLVVHFVYILAQKGQFGYNQYGSEPCDGAENNATR